MPPRFCGLNATHRPARPLHQKKHTNTSRLAGDKVALIGNVNCGPLSSGTDQEVIESARYALKHGMPGGGYVFATSNCIYTGMPLRRYDLMLDVWRKEGSYSQDTMHSKQGTPEEEVRDEAHALC